MTDESQIDDSKMSLTEHLTELRGRIIASLLAVVLTSGVCLAFAPTILDYSVEPLAHVLRKNTRLYTVLVDARETGTLHTQLKEHPQVDLQHAVKVVTEVPPLLADAASRKAPIDLVLIATSSTTTVADAANGADFQDADPQPYVFGGNGSAPPNGRSSPTDHSSEESDDR